MNKGLPIVRVEPKPGDHVVMNPALRTWLAQNGRGVWLLDSRKGWAK